MIKLSHDTLRSSPDENANCHRLCIDPLTSNRKKSVVTYTAKRYTFAKNKYADPKHETLCTVKFPASSRANEQWALGETAKSIAVREIAAIFEKTLNKSGPQLTFLLPQYASLESVAILSKRRVGEYVLCEDRLSKFTHFVDINGRIVQNKSSRRKASRCKKQSHSEEDYDTDCCSDHQHGSEHVPSEPAFPAQDMNFLTPTCPTLDDNPPSYDELYGPYINVNNRLEADYRNLNLNYVNYYSGDPAININQLCHLNVTSCTANCWNNVRCEVAQPKNDITNSAFHETDNLPHPLLRAFIHFDFYQSKGHRVVSNLKGMCEPGDKYTLTTPTFHSLTGTHGERDMGEAGMRSVIVNHACSRWCRHLPTMLDIFLQAQQNPVPNRNMHRHD